jgi:hypothetical protein
MRDNPDLLSYPLGGDASGMDLKPALNQELKRLTDPLGADVAPCTSLC